MAYVVSRSLLLPQVLSRDAEGSRLGRRIALDPGRRRVLRGERYDRDGMGATGRGVRVNVHIYTINVLCKLYLTGLLGTPYEQSRRE